MSTFVATNSAALATTCQSCDRDFGISPAIISRSALVWPCLSWFGRASCKSTPQSTSGARKVNPLPSSSRAQVTWWYLGYHGQHIFFLRPRRTTQRHLQYRGLHISFLQPRGTLNCICGTVDCTSPFVLPLRSTTVDCTSPFLLPLNGTCGTVDCTSPCLLPLSGSCGTADCTSPSQ